MGSTASQVNYKDGFETSNHTFMNAIVSGLQKRISEVSPDLELVPSGKQVSGNKITLTLSGQIIVSTGDDLDNVDTKVRQFMDSIRNPSNFISLIDE